MPARRTVVRLLLLFLAAVAVNVAFIAYIGVPDSSATRQRYTELIGEQSELIARLNRNVSRLQRRLDGREGESEMKRKLPWVYVITPTYARWTQKADLTRLSQSLAHVTNLHWILVEDSVEKTELVTKFLQRRKKSFKFTHLNVRTEEMRRLKEGEPVWRKNRGVEQRNKALQWLRDSAAERLLEGGARGVVYFGDDDNTYDIDIFEEMRYTKRVSVWLVGISGGVRFEGPVCRNGRVTGWYTMWGFERAFQIDMAGFAVNLELLLANPEARIDSDAPRGHLETSLLERLVSLDQLEPRGDNCTKVLVWHTRTEVPNMKHEDRLIQKGHPSNPEIET